MFPKNKGKILSKKTGKKIGPTENHELLEMANNLNDFNDKDIENRKRLILDSFVDYVKNNDLIKK